MISKDYKMKFHFCDQKKEIITLKNYKNASSFLRITSRPFCGRVEVNKMSLSLRVFDQWGRRCVLSQVQAPG